MKTSPTLSTRLTSYLRSRKLVLLLATIYTAVILLVTLNRFWQFEVFYYDQGLFERAIWLVSRLKPPIIEHQTLGTVWQFADHFLPSVYIMFSPWYLLTQRPDITLIAQAIYTGISVIVAYEIARLKIKNPWLIYALLIAFMGYVGLQNALIFYIHDLTAMILPLMLLLYFLFKEKWRWFWVLFIFNLGFKETVAVVGLSLGIFMWIYKKSWRRKAIMVSFISIGYGYVVTKFVIPFFAEGKFLYFPVWPTHISEYFTRFVDMPIKVQAIFYSLATFGFLPLLTPPMYPLILQDLFLRFVLSGGPSTQRWDLGLHYNANLVVFLFISSILAVAFLEKQHWFSKKIKLVYAAIIVVTVLYLHQFVLHGPFGLVYNPEFYRHTARMGFMHDFIKRIPTQGKIMVQNNLAVFFTHYDLYVLRDASYLNQVKPDVVAFDLRPGQNPNNFWPMSEKGLTELVNEIKTNKTEAAYQLFYQDGSRYIFVKK